MYMFGDVRTSPQYCKYLATLIEIGLSLDLVQENTHGFLFHSGNEITTACANTIAVIGLLGSVEVARHEIYKYWNEPWDQTSAIARALGFKEKEEEIVKRVVRWQLIENLDAKEVAVRLYAAV
jgi:hypothetical protein